VCVEVDPLLSDPGAVDDDDSVAVRRLVADDLEWVVDLAGRSAERRQSFAPRFWRRAPDARRVHAGYLGALIADPGVAAMRTEHTFAVGIRRSGLVLVDDAAADRAERWASEAAALLRRLAGACPVRFVCPVPEPERTALAVKLGLSCAQTWWHRDLNARSVDIHNDEPLHVRGAQGHLVAAPPVYAPGGPVLLVTQFHDRRGLTEIAQQAADRGAVVSVVTHAPDDRDREELLLSLGYRRTCDFYEGTLNAGHQPR
jgi:hypothetical protein